MSQKYSFHYETPIGRICIEENGRAVTRLDLCDKTDDNETDNNETETPLIKEAHRQLMEYFEKKRTVFSFPIEPEGTEFQKKVWEALRTIPYGEIRSYGEIAAQVGSPKGCRAVGGANHKNSILIVIPCHRVIGANGDLTGFGGGISVKEFLLALEGREVDSATKKCR